MGASAICFLRIAVHSLSPLAPNRSRSISISKTNAAVPVVGSVPVAVESVTTYIARGERK